MSLQTSSHPPVAAADSGSPPVRRCGPCSQSASSAAAAEKAEAAGFAHWKSEPPEWHREAFPAANAPEGGGGGGGWWGGGE